MPIIILKLLNCISYILMFPLDIVFTKFVDFPSLLTQAVLSFLSFFSPLEIVQFIYTCLVFRLGNGAPGEVSSLLSTAK